jgi:hypothetical protein
MLSNATSLTKCHCVIASTHLLHFIGSFYSANNGNLTSSLLFNTIVSIVFKMALRQILSKAVLPSLEADLTKVMGKEVAAMDSMLGPMMPTQVFGYSSAPARGAFSGSAPRSAPVKMERVNYPAPAKGLFN